MGGIFNLEKVIAHNAWCTGQGWSLHFSLISKNNLDESHWSLKETNGATNLRYS